MVDGSWIWGQVRADEKELSDEEILANRVENESLLKVANISRLGLQSAQCHGEPSLIRNDKKWVLIRDVLLTLIVYGQSCRPEPKTWDGDCPRFTRLGLKERQQSKLRRMLGI